MKVAIVTVDGVTVSQHFGRSPFYRIIEIRDSNVVNEEIRKRGTGHFAANSNRENHHEVSHFNEQGRHGYGADADAKHRSMVNEIGDCDVLIAGGMGSGAYESFKRAGLDVILTDLMYIEDVVNALISGNLENLADSRTD